MASWWPLDLEVIASLLHLWLSLMTFMVVQFITFMGKFYYIHGLEDLLHLWFKVITFMVSITVLVNFYYISV